MRTRLFHPAFALSLVLCAGPAVVHACNDIEDGCLGCSDAELVTCVDMLIAGICDAGGGIERCDTSRVRDDAERSILINTGRHMSKIRTMVRSARKYQDPHAPHR